MISKTYELSRKEFYKKFFNIYNLIQPDNNLKLREREIDVLCEFIILDKEKYKLTLFRKPGRDEVIRKFEERGIEMSFYNINTNLDSLKKKGLLVHTEDKSKIFSPKMKKIIEYIDTHNEITIDFKFMIND